LTETIVAIVGSRKYLFARDVAEYVMLLPRAANVRVISGESPGGGPDIWARDAALDVGLPFTPYPPKTWPGQTRQEFARECYARNELIAKACTRLVAFRSGPLVKSNGTDHVVKRAVHHGKPVEIRYDDGTPTKIVLPKEGLFK
jgi:hypothetical protein